ncbi:MAG: hypothetical protein ABSD47_01705 [Candidatus Methylomirabilota bacterium]|jgi:hypothetical protein
MILHVLPSVRLYELAYPCRLYAEFTDYDAAIDVVVLKNSVQVCILSCNGFDSRISGAFSRSK